MLHSSNNDFLHEFIPNKINIIFMLHPFILIVKTSMPYEQTKIQTSVELENDYSLDIKILQNVYASFKFHPSFIYPFFKFHVI